MRTQRHMSCMQFALIKETQRAPGTMLRVAYNFYSNKIISKVKISLTASFYIVPSRESLFARTNIKNKYYNEKLK